MAAAKVRREQDEALADRIGRRVVVELSAWLAHGKTTDVLELEARARADEEAGG